MPIVWCGARRRSVGLPGLKAWKPSGPVRCSGTWECPNTTASVSHGGHRRVQLELAQDGQGEQVPRVQDQVGLFEDAHAREGQAALAPRQVRVGDHGEQHAGPGR